VEALSLGVGFHREKKSRSQVCWCFVFFFFVSFFLRKQQTSEWKQETGKEVQRSVRNAVGGFACVLVCCFFYVTTRVRVRREKLLCV